MRVYHDFFWYPDPVQRFLMRIRIRPNDTDPTGSETLARRVKYPDLYTCNISFFNSRNMNIKAIDFCLSSTEMKNTFNKKFIYRVIRVHNFV